MSIDTPSINDNRNYNYSGFEGFQRKDYNDIIELIKPNSKILDLGCGNGALMLRLIKERNSFVKGIEISGSGVEICKSKGLNVIRGRIDESLPFEEDEFDYSICHITIQMVMYPEVLLREMKRVSKFQIVSFPNFAFYKNRLELFFKGRMPKKMLFGYSWYNTGHIHQLSIQDFEEFIRNIGGFEIIQRSFIKSDTFKDKLVVLWPNLLIQFPIYLLRKTNETN
ncbi:SAM-dependent methyltransferase [Ignavibacterium album JCM 16511]|uniref:SAM-dependent methyltransferase n=1 Tax=Ignavibacterium album (strain DSM 19864 / JCM 16511 / NBRC 101810 / Mat9-16) TaxID=945713 RepID=I0ANN1_IGNAJ|nr:methionine biosynthesis protein MetW [Ignavibacterium album]AFH50588.1 SAM-dependent methyltransferase [Ignavibacterium album JCM 16511]